MRRWRFESQRIPVGRLNIFEVRHELTVVNLVLDMFALIGWNWVSTEYSRNVLSESIVNLSFRL